MLKRTKMVGAKTCHSPACPALKLVPGDGEYLDNPTEYRSLVGSLQYLTWTRPEISFAVNQVCQHMQRPTTTHMTAAKRILSYVKGTIDYDILFTKGIVALQGFSDADWAVNPTDRKSTSGFCLFFGPNPITWSSRKQSTIARSSTEVEYRCLAQTAAELVWVCQLMRDLHIFLPVVPSIGCENISSISLASNLVMHSKMKHVAISFHFIRELVQSDHQLQVFYISTLDQVADVFTKSLHGPQFNQLIHKLRVLTPHELEEG